MKLLVGLLLFALPVCQGYMYLEKAGNSTMEGTDTLRGEKPGNIWNPPKKGGNRIPCGGKGNTKFLPTVEERMRVTAGENVRVVGKLTLPADLDYESNFYSTPYVQLSIKYGDAPNFQMTRGFTMDPIWAPKESGFFQLIRAVDTTAHNKNATVQVSYHVSPAKTYYQCVDIWITGGSSFPDGDFPWGKGPDDYSVPVPPCVGGDCGVTPCEETDTCGLKGVYIAIIILCVLIAIVVGVLVYLVITKKDPIDDPADAKNVPLPVVDPPEMPAKPEEPKAETPPKEESDHDPVGHVMYTPAEESDPTPQESSEQKSLDNTGSQGRHFHFRYVDEDGDDGHKEDLV